MLTVAYRDPRVLRVTRLSKVSDKQSPGTAESRKSGDAGESKSPAGLLSASHPSICKHACLIAQHL